MLVVQHDTPHPALDGLYAAGLAATMEGASFVRLRGPGDLRRTGGREHVAACGALLPNSLVWPERATGRAVGPEADRRVGSWPEDPRLGIVAWNRESAPPESAGDVELWLRMRSRRPAIRIRVEVRDGALVGTAVEGAAPPLPVLRLDRFGRAHRGGPRQAPVDGPPVVLVGEPAYLREVYPAVLAALGDACDAARVAPPVEVVSPYDLDGSGLSRLDGVAGILIPSAVDMAQAEGLIAAARYGLEQRIPTLGICLGMQAMATALARTRAGLVGAHLEQVEPRAPLKSCRRLLDPQGQPMHRLGAVPMSLVPGTRLAALFGTTPVVERTNHRYHLNPDILPRLEAAGLVVSARAQGAHVVDGIEVPDHPFFCGMQGRPELSSRPTQPHPLLRAFVEAVAAERGLRRRACAERWP